MKLHFFCLLLAAVLAVALGQDACNERGLTALRNYGKAITTNPKAFKDKKFLNCQRAWFYNVCGVCGFQMPCYSFMGAGGTKCKKRRRLRQTSAVHPLSLDSLPRDRRVDNDNLRDLYWTNQWLNNLDGAEGNNNIGDSYWTNRRLNNLDEAEDNNNIGDSYWANRWINQI